MIVLCINIIYNVIINRRDNMSSKIENKYQMSKDEFLKQFGGIDLVKYDLEIRKTVDLLKELNK